MRPDRAAVGEPKMTPSPIRFALTEAAVVELMDAITATTARRIASEPDAPYTVLERRWREIGGMLELARRLEAHRLVRALGGPQGRPAPPDGGAALKRDATAAMPRSGAPWPSSSLSCRPSAVAGRKRPVRGR